MLQQFCTCSIEILVSNKSKQTKTTKTTLRRLEFFEDNYCKIPV